MVVGGAGIKVAMHQEHVPVELMRVLLSHNHSVQMEQFRSCCHVVGRCTNFASAHYFFPLGT